jgi:hypothetical protein
MELGSYSRKMRLAAVQENVLRILTYIFCCRKACSADMSSVVGFAHIRIGMGLQNGPLTSEEHEARLLIGGQDPAQGRGRVDVAASDQGHPRHIAQMRAFRGH